MADLEQRPSERKCTAHNPNNTRVRELSRLARDQYPDGLGDYTLPETPIGQHLAIALITHLHRAGQRNGQWLYNFCSERVPWLDPDEIDATKLLPDKAPILGKKLELTAERRDKLHITSIAPCDQTPEQRAAIRKARKRERDREYRRRKRIKANSMRRDQWLAAHSSERDQPWLRHGISRATFFRQKQDGRAPATTETAQHCQTRHSKTRDLRSGETGVSPRSKIVGGRRTSLSLTSAPGFVESDGGRSASAIYPTLKTRWIQRDGMRCRMVGDCAVRAVAVAFGISYDEAFRILDAGPDGCARDFASKTENMVINGWRLRSAKEMTGRGRYICTERRGGHVVAYIDGARHDLVLGQSAISKTWALIPWT